MILLLSALLSGPAAAAPGWTQILPLGVPQLAQGRPKPALIFGAPQLLGAAASTWAITEMREATFAGDVDRITNHVLGDACTPGNAKECTFETVRPVVDHCFNGDLDDLLT